MNDIRKLGIAEEERLERLEAALEDVQGTIALVRSRGYADRPAGASDTLRATLHRELEVLGRAVNDMRWAGDFRAVKLPVGREEGNQR